MSKFKVGDRAALSFPLSRVGSAKGTVVGIVLPGARVAGWEEPWLNGGVEIKITEDHSWFFRGDVVAGPSEDVTLEESDCADLTGVLMSITTGDIDGPTVEGTDVIDSAIELVLFGVDFDSELAWACDVRPGRPYPFGLSQDWVPAGPSDLVSRLKSRNPVLLDAWLTRELGGDCEGQTA